MASYNSIKFKKNYLQFYVIYFQEKKQRKHLVERGRKEQTEKAFQKRQQHEKSRDRSLNAGVYKLRPAHRRHNKCWGGESCHTPLTLMKRKPFRKLLVLF